MTILFKTGIDVPPANAYFVDSKNRHEKRIDKRLNNYKRWKRKQFYSVRVD